MACDFHQCGIFSCLDSDERVQPPFKHRKRLAKGLIRLRVCTGWSESLLVAHTILLEISYRGSNCIEESRIPDVDNFEHGTYQHLYFMVI